MLGVAYQPGLTPGPFPPNRVMGGIAHPLWEIGKDLVICSCNLAFRVTVSWRNYSDKLFGPNLTFHGHVHWIASLFHYLSLNHAFVPLQCSWACILTYESTVWIWSGRILDGLQQVRQRTNAWKYAQLHARGSTLPRSALSTIMTENSVVVLWDCWIEYDS